MSATTDPQVAPASDRVRFDGPLEVGRGIELLSATGSGDLEGHDYREDEYLASGRARSFAPVGDHGADGRWEVTVEATADFCTRVVVRRPRDPAAANGTVVVEWFNVSSGSDAAPDYTYLADEILRGGYVWVGVSAQQMGVTGGESIVGLTERKGLRTRDPDRYGALEHPGDSFSFDLFAQVGRTLLGGGEKSSDTPAADAGVDPLDGLAVARVLAIGESQSAFRLTTFINAVHRLDPVFDGFLVHSRPGAAATLGHETRLDLVAPAATRIRDDLDVPVIVVQAETDVGPVLGYHGARQPDSAHLRVWEIAGTAHADAFQLGAFANMFGCAHRMNEGPQHVVVKAALRHLDRWVRGESEPPTAPRLTAVRGPALVRDGFGNVLGGIRTPLVDVPTATLSGDPSDCENPICRLFGSTVDFDDDRLVTLYPDREAYLEAFAQSADDAIASGFVLADDRSTLMAMATDRPWPVPAGDDGAGDRTDDEGDRRT